MKSENLKSILILIGLLPGICCGFGFSAFSSVWNQTDPKYVDVAGLEDRFVTISNTGEINWISETGQTVQTQDLGNEELNCLSVNGKQAVAGGNKGALFISVNNSLFRKIESGTSKNIHCVAQFRDKLIVGTGDNELRYGNEGGLSESVQLDLKGRIVSISSGNSVCYAVTDRGEIIHSTDSKNWIVFDFNEVYKGYYKKSSFVKVVVTSTQVAVLGENEDGTPVLFFSSKGNVWTERPLIYTNDDGFRAQLSEVPVDIYYDAVNDQFILLCNNGRLMTIPSCSHCHRLFKITDIKIHSISGNERHLVVVGDNNFINIIDPGFL